MTRYLKDKNGFLYAWNPYLAKNRDLVEVEAAPPEPPSLVQTDTTETAVRERKIYTRGGNR